MAASKRKTSTKTPAVSMEFRQEVAMHADALNANAVDTFVAACDAWESAYGECDFSCESGDDDDDFVDRLETTATRLVRSIRNYRQTRQAAAVLHALSEASHS